MKGIRERIKKEKVKKAAKILVFFLITCLPFISITNTVGMETFIDSFENSDAYIFLENTQIMSATKIDKPSYMIIQKIDHPDFEIQEEDKIMYCSLSGDILCNKINNIQSIGTIERYEVLNQEASQNKETIYKNQIIGKVVNVLDENIWNSLCLNFWSIAIENLNINSLF